MSKVIIRPQTHEDWLACRMSGIGSSEVATIIGANPYETPYQLWRRKKGIDGPKEENSAMHLGHVLEPAVAQLWQEKTGKSIIKRSAGDWVVYDEKYPYMRVSPDRLFWGKDKSPANRGILECKTTQMRIDEDSIPKYWLVQLQYQLGVMGLKHGALAWLSMGRDFGHKSFPFHKDIFEAVQYKVTRFWEDNILGDRPPKEENSSDILLMFDRHTDGKQLEATPEIMDEIANLKLLKAQKKQLEESIGQGEEKVKLAMMDAGRITCSGMTLVTWETSKPSQKLDTKALMAAHPEICQQYMTETPGTRRFLVK